MNAAKQAVIADAERAGYSIERHDTCVDIVKRTKHAKPRVAVALRIYEDGTAFDATMDLSVATAIRSVADMRAFLGI